MATIGRLFFLQVLNSQKYQEAATRQQTSESSVEPKRGSVYLRSLTKKELNYVPVAITKNWWHIWVSPKDVEEQEKENLIASLVKILAVEESIIRERLSKEGDPYEPLKDKVDADVVTKIKQLESNAVHWQLTENRYYPLGELASHVIGFVGQGSEGKRGQYGLEEFYNDILSGHSGFIKGFRNPLGFLIWPLSNILNPSDGADLYLTIDYNIQLFLERELEKAKDKLSATSASGIIINPKTGEVMAMASSPSFSPNTYSETEDVSLFLNPLTQKRFEPGSVFKPLTMAAGLDINVISPNLTYNDKGFVRVGDATIKNSTDEQFGIQTMTQVLEKSLNTGMVFVVNRIPKGVWREYLEDFGLAQKTGIDLVGELKGNIRNVNTGRKVELATSAFGQGIAITPLQLTMAIGSIANGGELLKPYVVERINKEEEVIYKNEGGEVKQRVIKEETANKVTQMMVSVVENGFGSKAAISGYSVAGKTGTAQVASPTGGYSDETIHSFIGFAPAFNPAFVLLITIENPKGIRFSSDSTAPIFEEVGNFVLHYLGIEPDKPILD